MKRNASKTFPGVPGSKKKKKRVPAVEGGVPKIKKRGVVVVYGRSAQNALTRTLEKTTCLSFSLELPTNTS